ncbi:MAG: hypothetical protein QMC67_14185 [Candidatus Wallbacteria bacterium]
MADLTFYQNSVQSSQINISFNFSVQSSIQTNTSLTSQNLNQLKNSESISTASNHNAAKSDSSEISISAQSLSFLRNTATAALSKRHTAAEITKKLEAAAAKFERSIESRLSRITSHPRLMAEIKSLYTLLDALSDGNGKLSEEFEKFWNDFLDNVESYSSGGQAASEISENFEALSSQAASIEQTTASSSAQLSASFEFNLELKVDSSRVILARKQMTDPLIIDLEGNGAEITKAEDGIKFDIDGDGGLEQTAISSGNDGLLALDKNSNGIIDNGTELFGDQNGAKNGFSELAKYDENNDGQIDSKDSIYDELKVVKFKKMSDNKVTQELLSLKDIGILAISLSKIKNINDIINGNILTHKSSVSGLLGKNYGIYEANFANYKL